MTLLMATGAGLVCCSLAAAKPPLENARPGISIDPVSIAKVKRVNGRIVLNGDWIPYSGTDVRHAHINFALHDASGQRPAMGFTCSPGTGCVPSCDTAPDSGNRWYFGTGYHNPNTVEDMQNCACPANSLINAIHFSFFWGVPSPSHCIVIFFPLEEVIEFNGSICGDPATFTDTGGGGIAIDFGILPPSTPFFYFSCPDGLQEIGMLTPGTDDNGDPAGFADGSYQEIIADSITSSAIVLASGPCQPMLWGTSTNLTGPADCRPGHNNADSFDDDSPTDGVLSDPAECYDYTFGVCPDPLGKANCFDFIRCSGDYNSDGFVDGIDYDMFNNDFEAGVSCADLNGDCFIDGIDYDLFNNKFETVCP